ncbi:response regulator [Asticcacaulis machinosus]|uniref:histidine kinase n=1 Tax=Asticcacaulis machinosus TaxID=2984211 RepID=A0ABT5HKP7_9CAUL|nr:response regulator [Asticcacaulis machinosus]MDC7676752.1 response regulator [Asticcacaulis machinosus]
MTAHQGAQNFSADEFEAKLAETLAAEERLKGREDFLKLLSHEIRTPLNGVMGMMSLLSRTDLSAEQESYIRTARDSGEHLLSMVNDLLDYARIDAGHIELETTRVDLESLLQGVAELLSPRAYSGGIEIVWSLDPRLETIQADEGRLRQILFNLAGNALKFTTTGGVLIHIGLTPESLIRFSVTDTGPGIPLEARSRIFEEYGQVDPKRDAARYGGAGLGLMIVKKLVAAMGGALTLDSEMGIGSTFAVEFRAPYCLRKASVCDMPAQVTLVSANNTLLQGAKAHLSAYGTEVHLSDTTQGPNIILADRSHMAERPITAPGPRCLILLTPEQRAEIPQWRERGWAGYLIKPLRRKSLKEQVEALHSQNPNRATTRPANDDDERITGTDEVKISGEPHVLLVEDNPVNALLAKILLQREGCLVERVCSGEDAIAILPERNFDIVFMDLGLPGIDGLGATRQIRAMNITTPVVALTANAYDEDRRACLQAGMNDFLTKPIEINALRQMLVTWTPRTAQT